MGRKQEGEDRNHTVWTTAARWYYLASSDSWPSTRASAGQNSWSGHDRVEDRPTTPRVGPPGSRQRVSREHGPEAWPRQIAVAAAPREPFPPYPRDLVMVPPDPSAVSGDAVVGAVHPDHPRQMGMLFPERTM